MKIPLRYVVEDRDRHGNVRLYYRRKGQPKIRLPGPIGSAEFLAAYRAAAAGIAQPRGQKPAPPTAGSIRWLCAEYFRAPTFRQLDPRTQRVRRAILDRLCEHEGEKPFRLMSARHIRQRRDAMAERPEAANALVKALRQLFGFAVRYEHADRNPAKDVEFLPSRGDGHHSWTADEIARFEAKHPIGTPARLAFALLLFTGQRRSDVVRLGRQHINGGCLTFTQAKNERRRPVRLTIPLHPDLRRIIDASVCGDLTFLVTPGGETYSPAGFGNAFRRWCDKAGLPARCRAHGLRKAVAARLAEAGCTELEIMAVTGHRTSKEIARYTRAADQVVRAEAAMKALAERLAQKKVSHISAGGQNVGQKGDVTR